MIPAVIPLVVALLISTERGGALPPVVDPRLAGFLVRLDRVAGLYQDTALEFACEETIVYIPGDSPKKVLRLDYIYERKDGMLLDYRTRHRRRRNVTEAPIEMDPAVLGVPYLVNRAYSSVFIFERSKWGMYRYHLGEEGEVLGRDAVRIMFEPVPPVRTDMNDWYGSAWIDRETSQLLRVEALRAKDQDMRALFESDLKLEEPPSNKKYEYATVDVTFDNETNGMRFPSEVEVEMMISRIRTTRKGNQPITKRRFHVRQVYDNYEFFGIRTTDEIRAYVLDTENDRPDR